MPLKSEWGLWHGLEVVSIDLNTTFFANRLSGEQKTIYAVRLRCRLLLYFVG